MLSTNFLPILDSIIVQYLKDFIQKVVEQSSEILHLQGNKWFHFFHYSGLDRTLISSNIIVSIGDRLRFISINNTMK